jgi:hypothetical protein
MGRKATIEKRLDGSRPPSFVGPLWSFASPSRMMASPCQPGLSAQLRELAVALGVVRAPRMSLSNRIREERLLTALAAELDAEDGDQNPAASPQVTARP